MLSGPGALFNGRLRDLSKLLFQIEKKKEKVERQDD